MQIADTINCGITVIDTEYSIQYWNRWMEIHSGVERASILGKNIFDVYPNLRNPQFIRNCRSILSFGNFVFISQKLHQYLFPFKPISAFANNPVEHMQQSCSMFPIRGEDGAITGICITVYDMTELVLYQMKLLNMSRTDMLTGLYNRRYLEERLQEEWERHRRHCRPLSLILFDIDHFKEINDTYGHIFGDLIIKTVAAIGRDNLRDIDVIGRYGGEEYCCILPDTNCTSALFVAERIRKAIGDNKIEHKGIGVKVTISAGVAQMNSGMEEAEELIKLADCALYKAKNAGRDKVALEI